MTVTFSFTFYCPALLSLLSDITVYKALPSAKRGKTRDLVALLEVFRE